MTYIKWVIFVYYVIVKISAKIFKNSFLKNGVS